MPADPVGQFQEAGCRTCRELAGLCTRTEFRCSLPGLIYKFRYGHLLFIEEEEDLDDDHRAGDVTTPLWLIAETYASFLDSVVSSDE